jgi:hypothetical protein
MVLREGREMEGGREGGREVSKGIVPEKIKGKPEHLFLPPSLPDPRRL